MYRALADAGVLDIDQEDGAPAKPMKNAETALALKQVKAARPGSCPRGFF
jgi:hypothetical protein